MPTEINGYSPSEETALSSLIINEVDSNETFEKMKEKGILQDNQLYLVTDELSGGGVDIPASDTEPATGNYWLDTSAEGGTYYTAGEVDALLQNKAPAGYGLGEGANRVDWNTATKNGFYSGSVNSPNGNTFAGYAYTDPSVGLIQVASGFQNGFLGTARRYMYNGAFDPWEWLNPPMTLGVEYRTTERYFGKPVYTMAFSTGNLGATGVKTTITKSTNQNGDALSPHYLVSCFGVIGQEENAVEGRYVIPTMSYGGGISDDGIIRVMAACSSDVGIQITVYAPARDLSSHSAVFTVKYTKTTDD